VTTTVRLAFSRVRWNLRERPTDRGRIDAWWSGEPPSGENRLTKLGAEPPPPSEYRDGVPPELDEIVLTALSPSQTDRQETIWYLRDDLASLWGW